MLKYKCLQNILAIFFLREKLVDYFKVPTDIQYSTPLLSYVSLKAYL